MVDRSNDACAIADLPGPTMQVSTCSLQSYSPGTWTAPVRTIGDDGNLFCSALDK